MRWFNIVRTQLKQISHLTRWARTSVKPQDDRVLGQIWAMGILSPIEDKAKCWIAFSDLEIAAHNGAIVLVGFAG